MQSKNLIILSAVTIALIVIAAVMINKREAAVTSSDAGRLLFTNLENRINDIVLMEIVDKSNTVTVEKSADNGSWTIREKGGYRASFEQIKQSILQLAGFKIIEGKTSQADRYSKIGVEDPKEPSSTSTLINLKNKNSEILATVVIGNKKMGTTPGGQNALYVRKGDDKQAWLVNGTFSAKTDAKDWLDKTLLDIKKDRLQSISFLNSEKKIVISKSDLNAKEFALEGIPNGRELKSASVLTSLASTLEKLNLDDVVPGEGFVFDEKLAHTTEYRSFDGLLLKINLLEKDKKWYVKIDSVFDPQLRSQSENLITKIKEQAAAQAEAENKKKAEEAQKAVDIQIQKDPGDANVEQVQIPTPQAPPSVPSVTVPTLTAIDEVKSEAETLQQNVKDWVYIIPAFKAANMTKKLDDLLKEKDKKDKKDL